MDSKIRKFIFDWMKINNIKVWETDFETGKMVNLNYTFAQDEIGGSKWLYAHLIESSLSPRHKPSWSNNNDLWNKLPENTKDFNIEYCKTLDKDVVLEKLKLPKDSKTSEQLCSIIINGAKLLDGVKTLADLKKKLKEKTTDNGDIKALINESLKSPFDVVQLLAEDDDFKGVGVAIACDFLKGSGLANIAKPDRHIRDVFSLMAFNIVWIQCWQRELLILLEQYVLQKLMISLTAEPFMLIRSSGLFVKSMTKLLFSKLSVDI